MIKISDDTLFFCNVCIKITDKFESLLKLRDKLKQLQPLFDSLSQNLKQAEKSSEICDQSVGQLISMGKAEKMLVEEGKRVHDYLGGIGINNYACQDDICGFIEFCIKYIESIKVIICFVLFCFL